MTDPGTSESLATPYDRLRARRLAERRAAAVEAARAAGALAAARGVRTVVFGSLVTGRFHMASDLDLALDGPRDQVEAAAAEVSDEAARHGFDCDVVPLHAASSALAERIARDGREPGALG